jgi:hypothetical protein
MLHRSSLPVLTLLPAHKPDVCAQYVIFPTVFCFLSPITDRTENTHRRNDTLYLAASMLPALIKTIKVEYLCVIQIYIHFSFNCIAHPVSHPLGTGAARDDHSPVPPIPF